MEKIELEGLEQESISNEILEQLKAITELLDDMNLHLINIETKLWE